MLDICCADASSLSPRTRALKQRPSRARGRVWTAVRAMGKKKDGLSTGLLGAEVGSAPAPAPAAPAPAPAAQPGLELSADEPDAAALPRTGSPVSPEPSSPRFDAFRPSDAVVIQSERGDQVLARTLFDEAATEAVRLEEAAKPSQRWMFVAFCLLEIVANFDAGLLPAVEMHMSREYTLAHTQAGLLGSLVYFGMVVGTPVAGYFLTNTTNQNVIVILGALLNSISIMMFALAPTQHFLYLGRFLMGVSQGGIFVYAPVWVDEFSPESRQALWMATLQGSVVLGIVLGYIVGGAFVGYWQPWVCTKMGEDGVAIPGSATDNDDVDFQQAHPDQCYNEHWKVGLYLQALCMGSFVLYYLGVDDTLVNSQGGERERVRWRTHALYREKIVELKPVNIDASVRRILEGGAQNSGAAPSSMPERMKRNLGEVMAALSRAPRAEGGSDGATARKSVGASAIAAPGGGKRRTSVPDLLDMFSHPQEGIGALVDLGEDMTQKLGAGSMSGGGNVQSVQGIMDLFGHEGDSSGAGTGVGQLSLKEQLGMLWQSSLYIWLTLALCSLYYVVTGTQFWITEYAQAAPPEGLGEDPKTVLWSFAFTSVTAPVIGVFLGGWVIDQQGGYEKVEATLRTCCYFGLGAAVAAVPAALSTDFIVVMFALWCILFFGGCIVSPATGVCINAVHADLRSFSSAMSMFA